MRVQLRAVSACREEDGMLRIANRLRGTQSAFSDCVAPSLPRRRHYSRHVPRYIDTDFAKCDRVLCQNCVTYPPKPR
jgi:hypothetical protein